MQTQVKERYKQIYFPIFLSDLQLGQIDEQLKIIRIIDRIEDKNRYILTERQIEIYEYLDISPKIPSYVDRWQKDRYEQTNIEKFSTIPADVGQVNEYLKIERSQMLEIIC